MGVRQGSGDSLLGVVPLVLRLGWDPPRPQAALDLLNLPVSPVPGRIARKLRKALDNWPAVGSEAWDAALAEGLAEIEDEGYRESVASRLAILMKPCARRRDDMPAAEIHRRVEAVGEWLRARRAAQEAGGDSQRKAADWGAALEQCRLVLSVLDAMELERLTPPELDGLAAEATAAVGSSSALLGRGRSGCGRPSRGPGRSRSACGVVEIRQRLGAGDHPLAGVGRGAARPGGPRCRAAGAGARGRGRGRALAAAASGDRKLASARLPPPWRGRS